MALDYLSIPGKFQFSFDKLIVLLNIIILATSIDVEQLFSHGRLLLSHTCSHLSVQTTRALLCLGSWSLAGLVKDGDVKAVAVLDEVEVEVELGKLAKVLGKTYRSV